MINKKLFNCKKITAIIAMLTIIASTLSFSAFAEEIDTSVSEITPIAVWDMTNIQGGYVYDQSGANVLTHIDSSTTSPRVVNTNDCVYSTKKAISNRQQSGGAYWPLYLNGGKNETILNTLDGIFTFSTWIKIDSRMETDSVIFSMIDADKSIVVPAELRLSAKGGLIFVRGFENSYAYLEVSEKIEKDKWYNVVISYNPATPTELLAIINGKVVTAKQGDVQAPSGNPVNHTKDSDIFTIGRCYMGPTALRDLYGATMGETAIYTGAITEAAAIANYNQNVGYYESSYNVKFYDSFDNFIENLEKVRATGNTVKIDLSGKNADRTTVSDVHIEDSEGNYVTVASAWESDSSDVLILSDFALTDGKDYKLVVAGVKNTDGELLRTADFYLPFKCNDSISSVTALAKYEAPEKRPTYQTTGMFGDFRVVIPNTAGTDYPALFFRPFKLNYVSKFNSEAVNSYYVYSGENLYNYLDDTTEENKKSAAALASKMDVNYTYETVVRIDKKDVTMPRTLMAVGTDAGSHTQLYISEDYTKLTLRREYDQGTAYFSAGFQFEVGKYYHIILSLADKKFPVAYINGVKYTMTHSGGYNVYAESVFNSLTYKKAENLIETDDSGKTTYPNVWILNWGSGSYASTRRPNATWAMSNIYEGVVDSYDAAKMYEESKAKFETYSSSFKTADGEEITADNIANVEELKASVTVTSSLTKPTVIMAVYNDGKLKTIKIASLKETATDAYTYETDLAEISEGDTVKLMCWDSLGNLAPITSTDCSLTKSVAE